jgi:hypothetical protein
VKVYRVERIKEPLAGRSSPCFDITEHWHKLPAPGADGVPFPFKSSQEWVCGTTSKKAFKLWWKKKDLHKLPEYGMKAVILEVPEEYVKKGKHQCLIKRDQAVFVSELTRKEL